MRGLDDLVAAGKINCVALSDAYARLDRIGGQLRLNRLGLVACRPSTALIERTAERELLPVAAAFGLSLTAWAPMGAGILTGKYTRGPPPPRKTANAPPPTSPASATAPSGSPARSTGSPTSSAPPRPRWRSPGCAGATGRSSRSWASAPSTSSTTCSGAWRWSSRPPSAPAWTMSRIEYGFPYELLGGPQGQMVYGDLEPQIDLPPTAPIRWPPTGRRCRARWGPWRATGTDRRRRAARNSRGPWGDLTARFLCELAMLAARPSGGTSSARGRGRGCSASGRRPGRGRLGRFVAPRARVPVPASVRVQIELVLYAWPRSAWPPPASRWPPSSSGSPGSSPRCSTTRRSARRGRTSGGARARIRGGVVSRRPPRTAASRPRRP